MRIFVFATGLVALPSYSLSGSTSFEACKADASGGDVVILSYISLRSTVRNAEDVAPWRPDGWIKDRVRSVKLEERSFALCYGRLRSVAVRDSCLLCAPKDTHA